MLFVWHKESFEHVHVWCCLSFEKWSRKNFEEAVVRRMALAKPTVAPSIIIVNGIWSGTSWAVATKM
jgi:hypothetical protein